MASINRRAIDAAAQAALKKMQWPPPAGTLSAGNLHQATFNVSGRPALGFRQFDVTLLFVGTPPVLTPILRSPHRGDLWMEASLRADMKPTSGNMSGIYVYQSDPEAGYSASSHSGAVAAVELSGEVIQHSDGVLRGEEARVLAIRLEGLADFKMAVPFAIESMPMNHAGRVDPVTSPKRFVHMVAQATPTTSALIPGRYSLVDIAVDGNTPDLRLIRYLIDSEESIVMVRCDDGERLAIEDPPREGLGIIKVDGLFYWGEIRTYKGKELEARMYEYYEVPRLPAPGEFVVQWSEE